MSRQFNTDGLMVFPPDNGEPITLNAFESIECAIAFDVRDWSEDRRSAWIYAIIDWDEDDVWEFLNGNGIEHCCLYDQGYKRLGCIGCPMNTAAAADLERYPAYKKLYLKAFGRMIEERKKRGLGVEGCWETPEKVMQWWLELDE